MFKNNNNSRQGNIELLRILCMFFILIWHFNLNVILRNGDTSQELNYVALFANSIAVVAVNTFVLISGYFSIKLKLKSIFGLLIQTEFYAVVAILLYILIAVVFHGDSFQKSSLLGLTPFHPSGLWFVPCYVQLLLLSPILNWWCKSKKAHKVALLLFAGGGITLYVFIGYKGYDLYNFILLYLTGRWISLYPVKSSRMSSKKLLILWLLSVVLTFVLAVWWVYRGRDVSDKKIFEYSAPWVYISSVLLFLYFISKSMDGKWILLISPSVFSVYLFHENSLIKQYVYIDPLKEILSSIPNDVLSYCSLLLYGILLFVIVIVFDKFVRVKFQDWLLRLLNRLEVWRIIDTNLKKLNE